MGLPNSNATAVLDYTLEHGGGTFNDRGYLFTGKEGYALSLHPEQTRVLPVEDVTPSTVTAYFHDHQGEDQYIGTWVHDGQVHFDVVTVVTDYAEALDLAVLHRQDAIFDLANGEEIFVDDVIDDLSMDHDDFPEYLEWQDLPWGGDDWDHGQYGEDF